MNPDEMKLVYDSLTLLTAAIVYLYARLDRFVTRDEFKSMHEEFKGLQSALHENTHSLRNQLQGWMLAVPRSRHRQSQEEGRE